ncbi:MAG TPA: hypothetical protein PLC89_24430 [Haliscomenobacter sp.]|uniref:hypothetical protein n=1 Tax=Haliscomenobacter sp. TaxID=2717303 RepID=UPI002B721D06|nr:hypothetical protein [Haliscomenobacter sp.]HOY20482.1 hypothetical protein [Haliscomenobacter sp.]
MADFAQNIQKCRLLIEQKLDRGSSLTWQNQDFEKLSEQIHLETGQLLSLSTLKRIWGKVKYDSRPNVATLDVLAQFIGYEHWRALENAQEDLPKEELIEAKAKPSKVNLPRIAWYLLSSTACLALVFWLLQNILPDPPSLQYSSLVFKSQPLTLGLPNTVVFEYDASHSNADSVFIQQSWDRRLRQKVDKQGKIYTSTYYIPGYYKAKLIFNDSIVQEHDVFIETPGWMGFLDTKPIPIYLEKEAITHQNAWGFSQEQLQKYPLNSPEPVLFVLANVNQKFTQLDSSHFELGLQLQNTYQAPGKDVCQKTFVSILGSKGLVNIPLCNIGCVGEVALILGNKVVSGKTNNLAAFGVDFRQAINLRCQLHEAKLTIFLNDRAVYSAPDPQIGKLAGLRVAFTGSGVMSGFVMW